MSVVDLQIPARDETTTVDNELFLARASGFYPHFGRLVDHSLGDAQYNTSAAIEVMRRIQVAGRKMRTSTILQGQRIMRTSRELNMPEGYKANPDIRKATAPKCKTRMIMHNPCERSFVDFGSATMDEIQERHTPIDSPRDDGRPLTHYSMVHGFEADNLVLLAQEKQAAVGFEVHAIDFVFGNCNACDDQRLHQNAVVAGAVWTTTNVPHIRTTDDQFAVLDATTEDENDHGVTDIFHDGGNVVYATYADDEDPATATAGLVKKSVDGGTTWTDVLSIADGLYCITRGRDYLWALGGDGAIYYSASGELNSWTQLVNSALATFNFVDVAYEPKLGVLYAVGDDDTDGKVIRIQNMVAADISSQVGTLTTTPLHCVTVLSHPNKHFDPFALVAIGGASGFYSENYDAQNSTTWNVVAPFTSDTIKAIEGSGYRTFVGAGSAIFERAIYTQMAFEPLTLSGVTIDGDINCGATGLTDKGVNYVAFGTENSGDGEIIMFIPADEVTV